MTEEIPTVEDYSDIKLRRMDVSDIGDFMERPMDHHKANKFFTSKEDITKLHHQCRRSPSVAEGVRLKGCAIGFILVTVKDICRFEVGYVLASKYLGDGIVTRAVKMVASSLFDKNPRLERLEALVDVQHLGSKRVSEKAGFQRECVLRNYMLIKEKTRDMVVLSLVRTDPQVHELFLCDYRS